MFLYEADWYNYDPISLQARHECFIIGLYPRDRTVSMVLVSEDILHIPKGIGDSRTQSFDIVRVW